MEEAINNTTEASAETPIVATSTRRFNIDQQCPIQYVTVYNDRAEVTRLVRHHFDVEGTYDLVFSGFSPFVDQTSLHVRGGTGEACTILEVSYQICYDNGTDQTDLRPFEQLQEESHKIEDDIASHRRAMARLEKQRSWLEGRATKLMNQDEQLNVNGLDEIEQFMTFYRGNLLKLDEQVVNEENEIKQLTQKWDGLQAAISPHGVKGKSRGRQERREVTITVHVGNKNVDVNLEIAYLISNCSWSASYDVRVNSVELSKQKTQLTYYGIIVNKSQENWPNAQLSLSTATPSIGGVPPKLDTMKISYYQPPDRHVCYDGISDLTELVECMDMPVASCKLQSAGKQFVESKKKSRFVHWRGRSQLHSKRTIEEDEQDTENTVNVLSTTTEASMSSASFVIPRRSTIDADGKPHKVTIAVLDLASTFIYTVMPKRSLYAYLKASTTNISDKQLLAGPVSVFMDNNFVTHSSIESVCLGDTFDLPLGTDASIKVESKPTKTIIDTQGLISKTHHESIRRETRLVNTKSTAVVVHVYEQVPLSSDEKIKVKLLTPDLRAKEQSANCTVTMNDANHLEWKCVLQPKGECQLPFEYTLAWPKNKRIEYREE